MKRLDFHVHALNNRELSAKQSAEYFRAMCEEYGYEGVAVLAFCKDEYDNNALALDIKEYLPASYAFASPRPEHDFAKEAEYYMKNGFDGIKLNIAFSDISGTIRSMPICLLIARRITCRSCCTTTIR